MWYIMFVMKSMKNLIPRSFQFQDNRRLQTDYGFQEDKNSCTTDNKEQNKQFEMVFRYLGNHIRHYGRGGSDRVYR